MQRICRQPLGVGGIREYMTLSRYLFTSNLFNFFSISRVPELSERRKERRVRLDWTRLD